MVSSTTMPSVMQATIDTDRPISPFIRPQTPNAIAAGSTFGNKLNNPYFTERNASKIRAEISRSAANVPLSMLIILRRATEPNSKSNPVTLACM